MNTFFFTLIPCDKSVVVSCNIQELPFYQTIVYLVVLSEHLFFFTSITFILKCNYWCFLQAAFNSAIANTLVLCKPTSHSVGEVSGPLSIPEQLSGSFKVIRVSTSLNAMDRKRLTQALWLNNSPSSSYTLPIRLGWARCLQSCH